MSKLSALFVLSCLLAMALAMPEARQLRQQQQQQQQQKLQHPYLFFSVPKGRANAGAVVQGFEIVDEDNDAEDDAEDDDAYVMPMRRRLHHDDLDDYDISNDDDDDDDDNDFINSIPARNRQLVLINDNFNDDDIENDDDDDYDDMEKDDGGMVAMMLAKPAAMTNRHKSNAINGQQLLQHAKPTQMMVSRDQAGAIMVPDGIIEIEGQSVVDEKTGKSALLVPRAALDAIPDGAIVALMERSAGSATGDNANGEERANRVIVRRRKVGNRRNVQRRRRAGRPVRRRPVRRRRGGNNNNRRRNVRVVRPNANRRRAGQRRRGQVVLQG